MRNTDQLAAADAAATPHPREVIMLATARLLSKRGFDGIRLRDVAKEARVSIGMIQHYFDSRDDLVLETLETTSIRRSSEWKIQASQTSDGRSMVKALLLGAVSDRERCLVWLETCAAASRHDELKSLTTRTNTVWRAVLRQAVDLGVEQKQFTLTAPPDHVVDILVALIDGLMMAVATDDPALTPEHIESLLLDTAYSHLGMDLD